MDLRTLKEHDFTQELYYMCKLAIEDTETDGDRIVGRLIAALEADQLINMDRCRNFYTEGVKKLRRK